MTGALETELASSRRPGIDAEPAARGLVSTWIRHASERHGARVAVTDGARELTFAEVDDRSSRLANALLALPGEPLGRVALVLPNVLEFLECDFAIAKARKVKVAVNTRLAVDEILYVLADSGAETVLIHGAPEDLRQELAANRCPSIRNVIEVVRLPDAASATPAGWHTYTDLLTASPARPQAIGLRDDPSYILYTSGTTGRPKGAVATDGSRRAATMNMLVDELDVRPGDGMLHVAPLAHGSGSKLLAHYLRGSRAIVGQRWDPAQFLTTAASFGASASFVVPTMLAELRDVLDRGSAAFPDSMRRMTYGGAVTLPDVMAELVERVGPRFVQVYGSCEAPHPVLVLDPADHIAGLEDRDVLRAAGRPATDVDVRIVADDDAGSASFEGPGELQVRGANLMAGYWDQDEATAAVLQDGWYRTGDVATRRPDGLITIVDRTRDMIITGGLNVYPAEVERVLGEVGAVSEVAVFGVPNERWGEQVTAAVSLRGAVSEEELIAHCRSRLAGYKVPKRVLVLETLPKGSTGKVAKQALRSRFSGDGRG